MQIYQLIHTLSYGDAISGEALAIDRCLHELGHQSKIFAINTHPRYLSKTQPYTDFPADFDGTVILHYSLGSALNELFRTLVKARRVIIFHNLTPLKYFSAINPRVAKDIADGWNELPELCRLSDLVISDSSFNAQELRQYGIESSVLPLPFDPQRWHEGANKGMQDLIESDPGIHILHIGRLAPNKCIEDILKTFYFLNHHYPQEKSRLWITGIDIDTELYSFGLKRLAHELHISDRINFTGPLTDPEIQSLYQKSTVYLGMSEHEGFCVPLIEAMHFGLPVIAYSCSAVTETVGNGGILFGEKNYPEIAQLIIQISRDRELRSRLISAGQQRVSELSYDNFRSQLGKMFALT